MGWFSFLKKTDERHVNNSPVFLTNTLTREKERFVPIKPGIATLYSCGPTVYNRAHIGNLRAYVFSDTLARTLMHAGYHVRRVINITDVGHLTDDGDNGKDKIEVGAKREGISAKAVSERYTKLFIKDISDLNIDTHNIIFPRATEYVKEQILLAKTLEEKGFAYPIKDGLYFDTSSFAGYGKLGGVSKADLKSGARVDVNTDKRNPADFALWKTTPKGVRKLQEWDSPWGSGCPGWHIECSAMSRALLGIEIDIHTGGIEHIPVHHNNEIAQSEAASGRPSVRYWMHNEHLLLDNEKLSKSLNNVVYLSDVIERGIHPLALRYFFHQAHYHTRLSFSWEMLSAASEALTRLWRLSGEIKKESGAKAVASAELDDFISTMRNDLGTPQAIGVLWDAVHNEEMTAKEKWAMLVEADSLLGLELVNPPETQKPINKKTIPAKIRGMVEKREAARKTKDFATSDSLRDELKELGYRLEDGENTTLLYMDGK